MYKVIDINTFGTYALKKVYLPDEQAKRSIENEVSIWKKLGEHENIVKFVDASMIKENGGTHALILCELCTQGTIFDLLQKYNGQLSE